VAHCPLWPGELTSTIDTTMSPGTVRGRIADSAGTPLFQTLVHLEVDSGYEVRGDSLEDFRFTLPPGRHVPINIRSIGLHRIFDTFTVHATAGLQLGVRMAPLWLDGTCSGLDVEVSPSQELIHP
jgi:hypothetical protein